MEPRPRMSLLPPVLAPVVPPILAPILPPMPAAVRRVLVLAPVVDPGATRARRLAAQRDRAAAAVKQARTRRAAPPPTPASAWTCSRASGGAWTITTLGRT